MSAIENRSPFERMMESFVTGNGTRKIEDFHPEDFHIIMDAIVALFFNQSASKGRKVGLEGLTDYEGVRIEFSNLSKYPSIRKDRSENYKIVVLPDGNESEELKVLRAKEALKEFDCLESIEKYVLCLQIFHSFSENELMLLASKHDPLKRDTKNLEERLKQRLLKREEEK